MPRAHDDATPGNTPRLSGRVPVELVMQVRARLGRDLTDSALIRAAFSAIVNVDPPVLRPGPKRPVPKAKRQREVSAA
jgi:hypothetical protein